MWLSHLDKNRILVVEDMDDERELMKIVLRNHHVVTATDFEQGLRLARHGFFDLYVLDNWLPGGTGLELCRRIREFDPTTPIIFYSESATKYERADALKSGAQAYLNKPVDAQEVRRTAVRLLTTSSHGVFNARKAELAAVREELAGQSQDCRQMVMLAVD